MRKENFLLSIFLFILFLSLPFSEAKSMAIAPSNCGDGIDNDDDGIIDEEEAWCHWDFDASNSESYDSIAYGEFNSIGSAPYITELYQYSNGENISVGGNISGSSIILSARIIDPDDDLVSFYYKLWNIDNPTEIIFGCVEDFYASGSILQVEINDLKIGSYAWKAIAIDEYSNLNEYVEFGNNDNSDADFIFSEDFSFVFMTDVHLGSNSAFLANISGNSWSEFQSYPRFTDVLYEIETEVNPKPDFILIGGDVVEYNNISWLEDFRNIIDDFSDRTGIKIYVIPGNHDRYDSESSEFSYEEMNFSGGNDYLKNYFEVMGNDENVISFFENDSEIMDDTESFPGGLNKYNYYFYYKGMQFIGLDSGEDTGSWDRTPEAEGVSDLVFNNLLSFSDGIDMPKIIFMHHPVFNEVEDINYVLPFENQDITDSGEVAQDNGFVHNWRNFINYCNENNIQLVLSGHTHQNKVFDQYGNIVDLSEWNLGEYPLYMQTQSATKDGSISENYHGYRIIDVTNGQAIPRESIANVTKYEKVIADLDAIDNIDFKMYDSQGNLINTNNNFLVKPFFANASKRKILYEDTDLSRVEIENNELYYDGEYDFLLQNRQEGSGDGKDIWSFDVYKINNPEVCRNNVFCYSFLAANKKENGEISTLNFFSMDIEENTKHAIEVNWEEFNSSNLSGLTFIVNNNYDTSYTKLPWFHIIDLNSPGELQVSDKNNNITGLFDGEIKSEIPYSFYDSDTETVYIYGDKKDIIDDVTIEIVGSYEATYDLDISFGFDNEKIGNVFADDIKTDDKTTHKFIIDWEVLDEGGKGVTMEFDEDGDGEFEKLLKYKNFISNSLLIADAGGLYEGFEGEEIIFDASASTSIDSDIIMYEWDFDGDGIFDLNTTFPQSVYSYEDDYIGKVFLRITNSQGITSSDESDVIIKNSNPENKIDFIKSDFLSDTFLFKIDYKDSGVLDTHNILLEWGDGSVEDLILQDFAFLDGIYTREISHKYENIEEYTIEYKVTDDDGGVSIATFTLKSPKRIKEDVLLGLRLMNFEDYQSNKKLKKAITNLEKALDDKYWLDDFHLNEKYGLNMFNKEIQVVKNLMEIIKNNKIDSSVKNIIKDHIGQIIESDIFLFNIAVSEKDVKVKSKFFQSIISSKIKYYNNAMEKIIKNRQFNSYIENIDRISILWNSFKKLNFSKYF